MRTASQLILLMIMLVVEAAPAYGSVIRILTMREPGVSAANIPAYMNSIDEKLTNTDPGISIVINLVDFGEPELLSTVLSGSTDAQLVTAYNSFQLLSSRELQAADLVFVFVDSLPGACGFSYIHWSDGEGLDGNPDLGGIDDAFIALIAMNSGCRQNTYNTNRMSHEFGHLLGADHHKFPGNDLPPPSSSRAKREPTRSIQRLAR